ncbi:hypothetical protein JGS22_015010 [Streptomyces sp. P38-E01]|uniref:Uncharacterized protein n=1 Tax=Streptomyces tardus TaxID=2780544 RepID=A0A949JHW0_9ACTN|nr:hypothetical protein [Streptomyces tardus]MBU7598889.1 hypothetical protein [Streptomyces tardus]
MSTAEATVTDQTRHPTRVMVAATSYAVAALTQATACLGEAVAVAGPLHQQTESQSSPSLGHDHPVSDGLATIERTVATARQTLQHASQVVLHRYAQQLIAAPPPTLSRSTALQPPRHAPERRTR